MVFFFIVFFITHFAHAIDYKSSFTFGETIPSELGYFLFGDSEDQNFGNTISRKKGDFNGDGYYDLLIQSLMPKSSISKIEIFFGSPSSLIKGYTIFYNYNVAKKDEKALSCDFIGDINKDSIDDIMICSLKTDSAIGPGKCYIIFGSNSFGKKNENLDLTINDVAALGDKGLILTDNLTGYSEDDFIGFGYSFAYLEDIDINGNSGLVISNTASKNEELKVIQPCLGGIYYILNNISNFDTHEVNFLIKNQNGFTLYDSEKEKGGCFGHRVSGLGDINGDGMNDFIVSAIRKNNHGEVFVIYGRKEFPPAIYLDQISLQEGFKITYNNSNETALGYDLLGNIDILMEMELKILLLVKGLA